MHEGHARHLYEQIGFGEAHDPYQKRRFGAIIYMLCLSIFLNPAVFTTSPQK